MNCSVRKVEAPHKMIESLNKNVERIRAEIREKEQSNTKMRSSESAEKKQQPQKCFLFCLHGRYDSKYADSSALNFPLKSPRPRLEYAITGI